MFDDYSNFHQSIPENENKNNLFDLHSIFRGEVTQKVFQMFSAQLDTVESGINCFEPIAI